MTPEIINFNYNETMKRAQRLDDVANKLKNYANKAIDDFMKDVSKCWISDNSKKYCRYVQEYKDYVLATAKEISAAADALRTEAERKRKAELNAIKIAQGK